MIYIKNARFHTDVILSSYRKPVCVAFSTQSLPGDECVSLTIKRPFHRPYNKFPIGIDAPRWICTTEPEGADLQSAAFVLSSLSRQEQELTGNLMQLVTRFNYEE